MKRNRGQDMRVTGRRWAGSVLAVSLALGGVGGLGGCGKSEAAATTAPAGARAVPVRLALAQPRDLPQKVRVVGTLAALEKATLSNRVPGVVDGLFADLGDRVQPGQKLVQIERKRYELAVQQAEQALGQSLARLGLEAIPEGAFDVDRTALVKKALSELSAAHIKFDRATTLYKQQLMKEYEYLDTQALLRVIESGVDDARDQARALLAAAREARANIDVKKKDLADTVIVAPDGSTPSAGKGAKIEWYTVAERRVSPGEYLKEGTMLFTVVADRTLKLQARVPERELAKVQVGQKVEFRVEAYPKETFPGAVTALDPTVDVSNRTFLVEATVDNQDGRLRAGSFVQADIVNNAPLRGRITVPVDAVTSFAGVNKVFVIEPGEGGKKGIARQVEVTLGMQGGGGTGEGKSNWIEVAAADDAGAKVLAGGKAVAVMGLSKLVDGSAVEILESGAAGSVETAPR